MAGSTTAVDPNPYLFCLPKVLTQPSRWIDRTAMFHAPFPPARPWSSCQHAPEPIFDVVKPWITPRFRLIYQLTQ